MVPSSSSSGSIRYFKETPKVGATTTNLQATARADSSFCSKVGVLHRVFLDGLPACQVERDLRSRTCSPGHPHSVWPKRKNPKVDLSQSLYYGLVSIALFSGTDMSAYMMVARHTNPGLESGLNHGVQLTEEASKLEEAVPEPQTKERRGTSVNPPRSMLKLLGEYCMCHVRLATKAIF